MKTKFRSIPKVAIVALTLLSGMVQGSGFDEEEWSVRCWNAEAKRWENRALEVMTLREHEGVTEVTNSSGVHRHAHLVFPADLSGDFTFTIELRGGYELGFLNREGKDEMLYLELGEGNDFETFTLSRKGSRISIERNGRVVPLVHFRFDYGEDFLITLAIKDGEAAAIRSYTFHPRG